MTTDQTVTLIGHLAILVTAAVNLVITFHVRRNTNGRLNALEQENERLRNRQE